MKVEKLGKVLRLFIGLMLFSVLVYGILNIVQSSTQAVPPKVPITPTPTEPPPPTPTPDVTPTPVPPVGQQLTVDLIAQEDQIRKKGIMIICPPEADCPDFIEGRNVFPGPATWFDPHAEYKIHIQDDFGVNVDPDTLSCIVVEKDVCHVPEDKVGGRQFNDEIEATELVNISTRFVCKYRSVKAGVGILEIYFIGPRDKIFIGDHILKVQVSRDGVRGSQIHDICLLGFPNFFRVNAASQSLDGFGLAGTSFAFSVKWPEAATPLAKFADALAPFASCKNAALWQREILGQPVEVCTEQTVVVGESGQ